MRVKNSRICVKKSDKHADMLYWTRCRKSCHKPNNSRNRRTTDPFLFTLRIRTYFIVCFGFNGPLRQYFSLYRAVSQREGGGRVVRRCWVNFQCRGVLLIWITVGQGPIVLAVGAGGVVWTFFLSSITSLFFLPLSGRRPDIDWNTVSKGR